MLLSESRAHRPRQMPESVAMHMKVGMSPPFAVALPPVLCFSPRTGFTRGVALFTTGRASSLLRREHAINWSVVGCIMLGHVGRTLLPSPNKGLSLSTLLDTYLLQQILKCHPAQTGYAVDVREPPRPCGALMAATCDHFQFAKLNYSRRRCGRSHLKLALHFISGHAFSSGPMNRPQDACA